MQEQTELLFFDTFSHENSEELNLDLVQFPKSVTVSEIRIIPLGAKVQGDFPGGVRLGATNPTQFHVDFFVNDLSKPGASTFETLGGLDYCQNGTIHMETITPEKPKIPTDGLVLKGRYTTITLAVYGIIVKPLTIASPPPEKIQKLQKEQAPCVTKVSLPTESSWNQTDAKPIPTYTGNTAVTNYESAEFPQESFDPIYRNDYYDNSLPKDPRTYHLPEDEWPKHITANNDRVLLSPTKDLERERHNRSVELERERQDNRGRLRSIDRERIRDSSRSREIEVRSRSRSRELKRLSRSRSRSRDRRRMPSNEKDWDRAGFNDRRKKGDSREGSREGSYERRLSPYNKRAPSYEHTGSYGKRSPRYGKRSPSYNRSPVYDKHLPYDRLRDVNHRSRSRSREDPRKRPRTPTGELRRPRSPNDGHISPIATRISDDEIIHYDQNGKPIIKGEYYHFKHEKSIRSPSVEDFYLPPKASNYTESKTSSLLTVKIIDTDFSCKDPRIKTLTSPNHNNDEDPEPFEPILSDEDDDMDAGYDDDLDYDDAEYGSLDDTIKYFNPFKADWSQYKQRSMEEIQKDDSENCESDVPFSKLTYLQPDLTKLLELIKVPKKREQNFSLESFKDLEVTIKEDWVRQCEKLLIILKSMFSESDAALRIFDASETCFSDILSYIVTFCKIGLSYECTLSQKQPTYKIRHLKCGIKLADVLLCHRYSENVVSVLFKHDLDISSLLLNMFFKDYMSLSVRLLIVKALDAFLNSKIAFEHFLEKKYIFKDATDKYFLKGYILILKMLQNSSLAQLKFVLTSILKKLNTYELLKKFEETVVNLEDNVESKEYTFPSESVELCINVCEELIYLFRTNCLEMSHPRRFLPTSAQFDLSIECSSVPLIQLCEIHSVIQCVAVLLTSPKTHNDISLSSHLVQLVQTILDAEVGVQYLYRHISAAEILFKYLTHPYNKQECEDVLFVQDLSNFNETQVLGLDLAFRLKVMYYLCAINDCTDDYEELVDKLWALYSIGFGPIGKMALAEVLLSGDNIKLVLKIINEFKKDNLESLKRKSPVESYMAEILSNAIKYAINTDFLKKYGSDLLKVIENKDNFDPGVAAILSEIPPYLKPLTKAEASDEVAELVTCIKSYIPNVKSLPGELLTSLLLLQSCCSTQQYETVPVCKSDYVDLRKIYNCIKLYSLDGVTIITSILEQICEKFDQPNLHTYALASTTGLFVARVCLACVSLLDEMISRVLRARRSPFRDTSAVPVIMKTFGLLAAFPSTGLSWKATRIATQAAVSALLAFAQPHADDADDSECLRRGPWTILCSEVLNYTLTAPHTFAAGLTAFSELLPLPLPIATGRPLSEAEIADAISDRKFWSAHLHALSSQISEVVRTACTSADRSVSHALRRVCVQIADLAPNTATMIARASVAAVARELPLGKTPSSGGARALAFLSCLLAHAPVKCAALFAPPPIARATSTRDVTSVLCGALRSNGVDEARVVQESAANALACLCAAEVTLSPERTQADSLPTRECLEQLLDATADCLADSSIAPSVAAAVLRAYFALTEHEYGFQAFKRLVARRRDALATFAKTWSNVDREEWLEVCAAMCELLRGARERAGPSRLSRFELADAVGWSDPAPLKDLLQTLKEKNADEDFIANVGALVTTLEQPSEDSVDASSVAPDIILPPPSTLIAQFESRAVWTIADMNDERLTEAYWLNIPPGGVVDEVGDNEMVQVDVMAIANAELAESGGGDALISTVRNLLGSSETNDALTGISRQKTGQNHADYHGFRDKRPFVRRVEAGDSFRSRPPNTSRPPSLHVDDFIALEGRTMPMPNTYKHNNIRGNRRGMTGTDRGRFASATPQPSSYRPMRAGAWDMNSTSTQHFPHFQPTQYVFGNGWVPRGTRGRRAPRAHAR